MLCYSFYFYSKMFCFLDVVTCMANLNSGKMYVRINIVFPYLDTSVFVWYKIASYRNKPSLACQMNQKKYYLTHANTWRHFYQLVEVLVAKLKKMLNRVSRRTLNHFQIIKD